MLRSIRKLAKEAASAVGLEVRRQRTLGSPDVFDNWVRNIERTKSIKRIFDVGANVGQTVQKMRIRFPRAEILAFEPNAESFHELQKNFRADSDVKCFNLALGARDGTAMLNQNEANVTNSLLENSNKIGQYASAALCRKKGVAEVAMARLDSFCAAQGIDSIDVLKIDAQGYEKMVLKGAGDLLDPSIIRNLFVEVLFVELYEGQTGAEEVMVTLKSCGYRLFGFVDVVTDSNAGWKWADALFVSDL